MHPKHLKIEDFTYDLPNEKIAYTPTNPRDSSKLLVYKQGKIEESTYRNIADFLPQDSVLVFNDTKVVKSRIFFKNSTGATIEVFCLEPYGINTNYEEHFLTTESVSWMCFIGKVAKWREPILTKTLEVNGKNVELSVEMTEKLEDAYVVKFTWTPSDIPFGKIMSAAGVTPLPPYIKRMADETDEVTYQTVYSEHEGSVAAPTAGLHFTDRVLEDFKAKGITSLFTTLHVGAGTFKPVKAEVMENHIMHSEGLHITLSFLESILSSLHRPIITVGTTSTRTLESIFWMGNKAFYNPTIALEYLKVSQWLPYETKDICSPKESISSLIEWMKARELTHFSIETEIIIAPGYEYRIAKGLITNFHQPQSTLLLLVSALIGDQWKTLYDYALNNDFRFLSYGDGSLLFPNAD